MRKVVPRADGATVVMKHDREHAVPRLCSCTEVLGHDVVVQHSTVDDKKTPAVLVTKQECEVEVGGQRGRDRRGLDVELVGGRLLLGSRTCRFDLNAPHRPAGVVDDEEVIAFVDLRNGNVVTAERELAHNSELTCRTNVLGAGQSLSPERSSSCAGLA